MNPVQILLLPFRSLFFFNKFEEYITVSDSEHRTEVRQSGLLDTERRKDAFSFELVCGLGLVCVWSVRRGSQKDCEIRNACF